MGNQESFVAVVADRVAGWRRIAYLMCGDWALAEDLLQQALLRMYVGWTRIDESRVDAYARKVLVRLAVDDARKPYRRAEVSREPPEQLGPTRDTDLAVVVRGALARIPPRQRAAVILRYFQRLSVAETASALGVTTGTVSSQTARGLAALRVELGPVFPEWIKQSDDETLELRP